MRLLLESKVAKTVLLKALATLKISLLGDVFNPH